MNNELIEQKSWWQKNWKWSLPILGGIVLSVIIFFTSGMDGITTDLAQAYTDTALYEKAIEKANANEQVKEVLGEIKPIDKLAILEGQVEYSNGMKTVHSTIRIVGSKGKAKMDIAADRISEAWSYTKINIRIKSPVEKKQTIEIITAE